MRRATGWFVLAIGTAVACLGCSSRASTPSSTSTGAVSRTDRVHEPNTTLSAQMPGDGSYRSVGEGKDSVQVHLRADQEALAADLVARYGGLVSITVGAYPYPLPSPGSITTPDLCTWSVPMGAEVVGGLRATPRAPGSVPSGHDGRGTVTVTNTSGVTVSFSAGTPYAAVLLKPDTDAVVGVYDSEIAGVGSGATL